MVAGVYVIFLAFSFHGPARWDGNQAEFGFFFDHWVFLAGLLFAAVHGTGTRLALGWRVPAFVDARATIASPSPLTARSSRR